VIVSLMFVTMLLAAGLLALERAENAYPRLIRGLVTPGRLLSEKVIISAGCATVVTLAMAVFISLFVHLDWGRFELWVLALGVGSVAFGALGVAIGAIAREVSAASLMAFLVSLPVAFVALVPANAVSGTLKSILDVIAFLFPFKAALEAVSNAFSGTSPQIGLPLVHLIVLAVVFGAVATVSMRRFATR
jgi:ABC-type multidrug transport system permease subunit